MKPKYKRILLKLSGEALAGEQRFGLNEEVVSMVVDQLVKVHAMGVEIALVTNSFLPYRKFRHQTDMN